MKKKMKILKQIRIWLLLTLSITIAVGLSVSIFFLKQRSDEETAELLTQSVAEIRQDLLDLAQDVLMNAASAAGKALQSITVAEQDNVQDWIEELLEYNSFSEVNIIDGNGIIIRSTVPEKVGYDMSSDEESAEFLCLLNGETFYAQESGDISDDAVTEMRYAGSTFPDSTGFVQIGIDQASLLPEYLPMVVRNERIGQSGYMLITQQDRVIQGSYHNEMNGTMLDPGISLEDAEKGIHLDDLEEGKAYVLIDQVEGNYVIGVYPESEASAVSRRSVMIVLLINIAVFFVLFFGISFIMKRRVVREIVRLNQSLSEITAGNMDVRADVRSSEEFSSLSDGINTTVDSLKASIAREAARIDEELALARNIQRSALPSVYPDRTDFRLHAVMYTAKEVGGDFYDFYLLDDDRLAFLVADVSGKGIPAAMFMMKGKSVLRGCAERGYALSGVFETANTILCDGNEEGMFITSWMGILETGTGIVRFANAGHNTPVLVRNGKAVFIPQKKNLLLGTIEGVPYSEQTLQLEKGDILFLYTDGVTEATNAENELYGDDRLLQCLSSIPDAGQDDTEAVCALVKQDLDVFVGDAVQFDDITMLCLRYE